MAESNQQADPSAALEIPSQDQEDFQQDLTKMGMGLERLMEAIKGEQGEIQTRIDIKSGTAEQCRDDISKILRISDIRSPTRMLSGKKASGSKVEDRSHCRYRRYRVRSHTPYN